MQKNSTHKSKLIRYKFDKFKVWTDNDDSLKNPLETAECFNFSAATGALQPSVGFKKLALPDQYLGLEDKPFDINVSEINACWFFVSYDNVGNRDEYYLVYLDQNMLCKFFNIYDPEKWQYATEAVFTEMPHPGYFRINDVDCLLLSNTTEGTMSISASGTQYWENIPVFISGCWHSKFFFLVTAGALNQLWYSTESVNVWTDYNKFQIPLPDIRGGLTKVVSFQDDLYLFQEFGITKISLYSTETKFAFSHIFVSSAYIFPSSIAKCGEYIMFMAADGMYVYDGAKVKKLVAPFMDKIVKENNASAFAEFYMNKYYLACRMDFDDGEIIGAENGQYVNNALIVYDISSKTFEISRGIDIKQLVVIKNPSIGKLCAIFRGEKKAELGELTEDGTFFGTPLKKVWRSSEMDFDRPAKNKRICEIVVKKGAFGQIVISSDREQQTILVQQKNRSQRLRCNVFGKTFQISFVSSEGSPKISCPEISVKVYE